jgi:hypothetical protein
MRSRHVSAIDPEWLQRELSKIAKGLAEEYPAVTAATVENMVRGAAAELVATARLTTYLPVLVRRAQARLYAIQSGQLTPVRGAATPR